jgi:hypothetical protein
MRSNKSFDSANTNDSGRKRKNVSKRREGKVQRRHRWGQIARWQYGEGRNGDEALNQNAIEQKFYADPNVALSQSCSFRLAVSFPDLGDLSAVALAKVDLDVIIEHPLSCASDQFFFALPSFASWRLCVRSFFRLGVAFLPSA